MNEYRNKKRQLNRISVTADLIKERATKEFDFEKLKQVDVLLYYISLFVPRTMMSRFSWFPETSCYRINNLPIIQKAISLKFLDKILPIFDAKSKGDLLNKINSILNNNYESPRSFHFDIPEIKSILNIDKIGIHK